MKKLTKLNNGECIDKSYQDALDKAKKIYPCIKLINYCCGCCLYPESAKKCCWKNYQQFDLSKVLNPFGMTQDNMCCICLWNNYPNEHTCGYDERVRDNFMSCCWKDSEKKENIMKKTTKNEIIVVPTTANKDIKKVKATKLRTPRTPASKSSTCAYYDCLIDLVSSPQNDHVKITELTHKCKCSKEEIQKTKAEVKHKLVHELARDYKSIGINLGKYVKADIVSCAKELKDK